MRPKAASLYVIVRAFRYFNASTLDVSVNGRGAAQSSASLLCPVDHRSIVTFSQWQGSCERRCDSIKYQHTDATALEQYPHQTASGRRELAASQDINNSRPASHHQEKRNSDRVGIACGGPEPTLHNAQLTSHHAPTEPAVQDLEHRRHPSGTSYQQSSPKNASTLPYHASSSPQKEPTFAIDFGTGKTSETLTRNKIQIPPRTRYAAH